MILGFLIGLAVGLLFGDFIKDQLAKLRKKNK